MPSLWISLRSIPAGGKEYILDDQAIWTGPMTEFKIPGSIVRPLRATLFVQPQERGVLARGRLQGAVVLPCDRCTEDALVELDQRFDCFEPFPSLPGESKEEDDLDVDREVVRLTPQNQGVELNLAALVWEEFSLALPVKPLCDAGCKGLCPQCGANRNTGPCRCRDDGGDPRLAALRGLTVHR